ncbi:trimeric LpxA-like protein [Dothidotthia symphoricarpi CBS 119687]|uniref:Dynactin subunit 6 n=1 Tax=Dothidotthia symphoricarpi CBS 119687 TaxID=1392245 RepID=A0A6A6AG85_9PLEO|nr:trimeric LpxA-like protein [Dothidotthia symphoricarpi CBS 119687]KAF2130293.1 trimeric LpxA-like protein [Dothidotthia symphoricarpi CBS 119687]
MSSQATPARPAPDRRSSTAPKRTSMLPKPSSVALHQTALIAQHAQLTGTHAITIGSNTVLHPHSKLSSTFAPVILGDGVIVYERAKVGMGMETVQDVESKRSSMASMRGPISVRLGHNVVVESNAVVEAAEVGEGSVVEVGAVLGRGCVVGKYCTIAASSVVPPYTQLPDYTIVHSGTEQRVDKTVQLRPDILEARMAVHRKQLDMFRRLIPNNAAKWALG